MVHVSFSPKLGESVLNRKISELFEKNKREKKEKIISDSLEKLDSKDTKARGKSSRDANVSNKAKQSTSVPESPVKLHVEKADSQK